MLIQTQLSNYDTRGKFILEADSGWQMVMGRIREILKLVPGIEVHVLGPEILHLKTLPYDVNRDIFDTGQVRYLATKIQPNALATRYNFDLPTYAQVLGLGKKDQPVYDWVYVNDPMHLRNFRALFHLYGKYTPKFAVHSHFIDNPSCPKFPTEASLWLGQVEASIRADVNFWQCQSALDIFEDEAGALLHSSVLGGVMAKSFPWDDGYSIEEVNRAIDPSKIRFDRRDFLYRTTDRTVIFVPNRVGGRGRSSDYTNCGKFLFEILPQIHAKNPKIMVVAGNPSQKFSNQELEAELGKYGFVSFVPDSLRREEYLWIGAHSDIAVGLYDQDSYGGTAARELVDLGCAPLWIDKYEYGKLAREAVWDPYLAKPDFSDIVDKSLHLISLHKNTDLLWGSLDRLRDVVRKRCSYEETTKGALRRMEIL